MKQFNKNYEVQVPSYMYHNRQHTAGESGGQGVPK